MTGNNKEIEITIDLFEEYLKKDTIEVNDETKIAFVNAITALTMVKEQRIVLVTESELNHLYRNLDDGNIGATKIVENMMKRLFYRFKPNTQKTDKE